MPLREFDPLNYDPIRSAGYGQGYGRQRGQQNPANIAATPEEVQGVGKSLLNAGGTGLSYILSTLDKPGRAARGLLGGKPEELANLIPFSDTLGITDPNNAVSGAQINKNLFGLKDDNSWGSWGAGMATDIVTDPLTYAGFGAGALTKAGKAAGKAGLLGKLSRVQQVKGFSEAEDALRAAGRTPGEITHMGRQGTTIAPSGSGIAAKEPLRGLVSMGIPGTDIRHTFGAGSKAAEAVAGAQDWVGKNLLRVPGAKTLATNFNSKFGRATTQAMMEGQAEYGAPAREAAGTAGRTVHYDLGQHIADAKQRILAALPNTPEEHILDAIGMHAEGTIPSRHLPVHPYVWNVTKPAGDYLRSEFPKLLAESTEHGVGSGGLRDKWADYLIRVKLKKEGSYATQASPKTRLEQSKTGSDIKRKSVLRGIPGATTMLNKLAQDPELAGKLRTLKPNAAKKKVFENLVGHAQAQSPGATSFPIGLGPEMKRKAGKLTTYLKNRPEPGRIFSPSLSGAVDTRMARQGRVIPGAKATYGALGNVAEPIGPGLVPLTKMLGRLGMRTTEGGAHGLEGALVKMHEALAPKGLPYTQDYLDQLMAHHAPPTPLAMGQAMRNVRRDLSNEINKFGIKPEHEKAMLQDLGSWKATEELQGPIKGLDTLTNAFRHLAYSIWPSAQVRNLASGEIQSLAQSGGLPGRDLWYNTLAGKAKADQIRKAIPQLGLPLGATDTEAMQALKRANYIHGNVGSQFHQTAELPGGAGTGKPPVLTPPLPLSDDLTMPGATAGAAKGIYQTGKDVLGAIRHPTLKNPFRPGGMLEMQGVGKGVENFPALQGGRDLGQSVENYLRGSQLTGEAMKGASLEEAGRRMLKTQFDYSALTPFERKFMRRAIPFYTYMSRNLPLQLETLASRPGAVVPQLRAITPPKGEQVPEYLASGVAMPTGDESPEGNRQFVSQLGIPLEEAFERLKVDPGGNWGKTATNTAMAYLAGMNPLVKGPLEALTGKQFFSGRDLSDLKLPGVVSGPGSLVDPDIQHSAWGHTIAQTLSNTPATRFLTMIDKMADPRKSLPAKLANLLTGVRVTDVDMNMTRAVEQRKALEQILRSEPGVSNYTRLYVKPEDAGKLSPEALQQIQALNRLRLEAQKVGEQKRAERLAAPPV